MPLSISGQVGEQLLGLGVSTQPIRQGQAGDVIVSELHGKYFEQNLRGRLFTFGISNTALVAANAIATGVTATAQPVLGLWNPPTSGNNLSVLLASVGLSTVANSAVSPGGFMWLSATGQGTITTGSTPFNCRTLSATGSMTKVFSVSTALTGMVGSLSAIRGSHIQSTNAGGAATAVTLTTSPSFEILDGAFIVPPGGVLALMNQVSTTTLSVTTGLVWEEVPA